MMIRRQTRGKARSSAGFSLLEGLVATAVLLIVVLGVLPLFSQSILNNLAGRDASQSANLASDQLDLISQAAFENPNLDIPSSDATRIIELFDDSDAEGEVETTVTTPIGDGHTLAQEISRSDTYESLLEPLFTANPDATWARVSIVRQYQITYQDGDWVAVRQPAGAPDDVVHIKEVETMVINRRPPDSVLAGNSGTTIKFVKGL